MVRHNYAPDKAAIEAFFQENAMPDISHLTASQLNALYDQLGWDAGDEGYRKSKLLDWIKRNIFGGVSPPAGTYQASAVVRASEALPMACRERLPKALSEESDTASQAPVDFEGPRRSLRNPSPRILFQPPLFPTPTSAATKPTLAATKPTPDIVSVSELGSLKALLATTRVELKRTCDRLATVEAFLEVRDGEMAEMGRMIMELYKLQAHESTVTAEGAGVSRGDGDNVHKDALFCSDGDDARTDALFCGGDAANEDDGGATHYDELFGEEAGRHADIGLIE